MELQRRYPGLLKDLTAAGTVRWSVRLEGEPNKKTHLPITPDLEDFEEAYRAGRAAEKFLVKAAMKAKKKFVDDLCAKYLEWFKELCDGEKRSPLTLRSHALLLRQACNVKDERGRRLGDFHSDLPREAFAVNCFGAKTGSADDCLKALRAAYKWRKELGYPGLDESRQVQWVHEKGGGATPWK